MADKLQDKRTLPIFIHSTIDDMDLSPEAFRVYAHLSRRAGSSGVAWPGIRSIGDKCFSKVYANPEVRDRHVRAALKELQAAGLVSIEAQHTEKGQRPNLYTLQDPLTPQSVPGGDSAVTPPPDSAVTPPPDSWVTPPLTLQSPEGTPIKGTPIEGSPVEGTPSIAPAKQRRRNPNANPRTHLFLNAYLGCLEERPLVGMAEHGRVAKILAQSGKYAPEDVQWAYRLLKSGWWSDKPLSLSEVAKQLPELKRQEREGTLGQGKSYSQQRSMSSGQIAAMIFGGGQHEEAH
jgi:hypothetical protein